MTLLRIFPEDLIMQVILRAEFNPILLFKVVNDQNLYM